MRRLDGQRKFDQEVPMVLAPFDYVAPETLAEAIAVLSEQDGARILAGGHTLLPDMKLRRLSPPLLVDLRRIGELHGIHRLDDGGFRIGGMSTLEEIAAHKDMQKLYRALMEAIGGIGDLQVRNRATIAGSLTCGTPGADVPAVALVFETIINVAGPSGLRTVPADGFFLGPFDTGLQRDEIVTSVDFVAVRSPEGSAYDKFKNPASHYAVCGIAARVVRDSDGTIGECRVAIIGAADRPMRLLEIEQTLEGQEPSRGAVVDASRKGGKGTRFVSDIAASGEYREYLTAILAERALLRAIERAGFRVDGRRGGRQP